jgi:hypothetical protein
MGEVEERVREALLKTAPDLSPLLLKNSDAGLKGIEPTESPAFLAHIIAALTRSTMILAHEIDLLRAEITDHQPPD